jgi:hypothetical protein
MENTYFGNSHRAELKTPMGSSETAENYIHVFGSSNHQDSPLDFSEYHQERAAREYRFAPGAPGFCQRLNEKIQRQFILAGLSG